VARRREQRLRRRMRAALRDRDRAAAIHPIAIAAIHYVNEIYAPNIREPFSIANRRADLVDAVRAFQASATVRRAA